MLAIDDLGPVPVFRDPDVILVDELDRLGLTAHRL
jgi:hypothetical protein